MAQRSIVIWVCILAAFPSADHPVSRVAEARSEVALLVAGEETLHEIAGRPNHRAVLCANSFSQKR
jgi:hypothetical protein